jgi:hypothetical protein
VKEDKELVKNKNTNTNKNIIKIKIKGKNKGLLQAQTAKIR